MPVLVTIAAVNYLFRGSKEQTSFLDPVGLRKEIEKLPLGPSRTRAIALVDRLDVLARDPEIVALAPRAMLIGFMATMLSASIVGLIVPVS